MDRVEEYKSKIRLLGQAKVEEREEKNDQIVKNYRIFREKNE